MGAEVSSSRVGGRPIAAQEVDKGKAADRAPQEHGCDAADPPGDEDRGQHGPKPRCARSVALLHLTEASTEPALTFT